MLIDSSRNESALVTLGQEESKLFEETIVSKQHFGKLNYSNNKSFTVMDSVGGVVRYPFRLVRDYFSFRSK